MNTILNLIEQGMFMSNLSATRQSGHKPSKESLLYSLITLLVALAYILVMAGLALWMTQNYAIPVVLGIMGGILFLTALCILGSVQALKSYKSQKIESTLRSLLNESNDVVDSLTAKLDEIFGENIGKAVLLSALSGFILSRKII